MSEHFCQNCNIPMKNKGNHWKCYQRGCGQGIYPSLKIGDKVVYMGEKYVIEKDYGNQVFSIGSEFSFCDLVPASHLNIEES